MNKVSDFEINDSWIVSKRGKKNKVDPYKPYAYLVEKERAISGSIEDTATIFLTNSECPFRCLMCDLWKNTTDKAVPIGAIPKQIELALENLPPAKHLKLYNSGNFFDKRAIPKEDHKRIAAIVSGFETLIIENHPKLITENCLRFRDMLKPELQIAMGLETVHPQILQKLNKRLTLDDFSKSVQYLTQNGIRNRAFILLKPPFMTEEEGIYWAKKSIDFAFDVGVECCIVIPVRAGNGAMDLLMKTGEYSPPNIQSLEMVLEYGIGLNSGRVFADVWDLTLFSSCDKCINKRTERLNEMNLNQEVIGKVNCNCKSENHFNTLKTDMG
jgi:archaeosine synthase beta-subunit